MPVLLDTSGPSTWNAQRLMNYARQFPNTTPALGVPGFFSEMAIAFTDDVVKTILAKSNPWKFNAAKFPAIETNPYQQDFPTNVSQKELGWLQSVVLVDINNQNQPIPIIPMTAVQNLLPTFICTMPQKACWIPNALAQTGTWPGPNVPYVNPLISQGGGPNSNPLTAITDTNGNVQVVSTYGVTGASQPTWPASGADPGTLTADGSVQWSLADPNGVALRLDALGTNNSQIWEIRVIYQVKPPNITTLTQFIDPIPDDLSYLVKRGFLCKCYEQANAPNFRDSYAQWSADIQQALGSSDREYQEFGFYPAAPIQGGGGNGIGLYNYPGWPGWSGIFL